MIYIFFFVFGRQVKTYNWTFRMTNRAKSTKRGPEMSFHLISAKQHVSDCIDLSCELLREVITLFCTKKNIECPFTCHNADLTTLVCFIIDNIRFDLIVEQFVHDKEEQMGRKQFLRSWLHELKSVRNAWAHWPTNKIDYRFSSRAYDTLSLIYLGLNGNPENQLFRKIELYRKRMILFSVEEAEKRKK